MKLSNSPRPRAERARFNRSLLALLTCAAPALWPAAATAGGLPLPGSIEDFFLPGTQPDPAGTQMYPIDGATACNFCHGQFDKVGLQVAAEPYRNWVGSMMGQASRDPVFYAALTIANQDMTGSGYLCLRCHAPAGFLSGHADPPDGSALGTWYSDLDGVTCNFCHRLVNPTYVPGQSPAVDQEILSDLAKEGLLPTQADSARYVVDPNDSRRGPHDPSVLPYNPHFGTPVFLSEFHKKSDLCGTCHDVSNPALTRQKDGTYVLNQPYAAAPDLDKYKMMPDQRTFSEWQKSQFATTGVQMNGRFGGAHPTGVMQTCQDCHMPKVADTPGCIIDGFPVFPTLAQHSFAGANTWVLRAINELYEYAETYLTDEIVDEAIAKNVAMLRAASDMTLSQTGSQLKVRITNFGGHKLPTGYQEGRRMWINVKFLDATDHAIAERGAYDFKSATLSTSDTKVYEVKYGLTTSQAKLAGLSPGESFHLVLNNMVVKDNRIPPIGYTVAGFESVQAGAVGATYVDGQNWDETLYAIPSGARKAVVTVYHQISSKEYMEFLRSENHTDNRGQVAYDMWVMFGKSAPTDIDSGMITINPGLFADLNGDKRVNGIDLAMLLGQWTGVSVYKPCPPLRPADLNGDCRVNGLDLAQLLASWTG